MWKIKYGTGAEEPYLYSTNNFLGRQVFEFDPDAGSPDERAEVEEARQNFYRNRHNIKPCSDHIWRLQVIIIIRSPQILKEMINIIKCNFFFFFFCNELQLMMYKCIRIVELNK